MTSAEPLERLEAWFVTGSQHLYGEAVLERVGEHAAFGQSPRGCRSTDRADPTAPYRRLPHP